MPSSSGMSTSIVTRSGLSACTLCSASTPFRAVAATRNSPDSSMICEMSRRMNALSSTTSTDRSAPPWPVPLAGALDDTVPLLEGPHFGAPIAEVKVHAPAVTAPDVLGDDANAAIEERLARGGDVALADVDAAGGEQVREHARAADELRAHSPDVRADARHLRQQEGDGRRGELGRIGSVARHRFAGQQHMGEAANASRGVIQQDRHARAEPDRGERLLIAADGAVGDLDADLRHGKLFDHKRRKMRSRASTGAKRARAGPRSVSTLPSTRNPPGASARWNVSKSRSCVSRSK